MVLTNATFWNGLTEKEHLVDVTDKVNNIAEKYNNASRQLIDNTKIISLTKEEVEMCKK